MTNNSNFDVNVHLVSRELKYIQRLLSHREQLEVNTNLDSHKLSLKTPTSVASFMYNT